MKKTLLGVNIDHVATVRQARRETFPDPVLAAKAAIKAGADGITAHLREDRRHIQDLDIRRLKKEISAPLNMEMGAAMEIVSLALKLKPTWVCLVPEKREELTTEGGLDLKKNYGRLSKVIREFHKKKIKVSLFIDADESMVKRAWMLGAEAIEIHTGTYARYFLKKNLVPKNINKIRQAALKAKSLGLLVNAGHGLNYENVGPLLKAYPFHELNIGFSIISRALFVGLPQAVKEMKEKINSACAAS
jgi:pyridoxine 5-phosphate synthase